jgi:hypothetical protein
MNDFDLAYAHLMRTLRGVPDGLQEQILDAVVELGGVIRRSLLEEFANEYEEQDSRIRTADDRHKEAMTAVHKPWRVVRDRRGRMIGCEQVKAL